MQGVRQVREGGGARALTAGVRSVQDGEVLLQGACRPDPPAHPAPPPPPSARAHARTAATYRPPPRQECQVSDLKLHKKSCLAPDQQAAAELITVNMSQTDMPGVPKTFISTRINFDNFDESTKNHGRENLRRADIPTGKEHRPDKLFVVKVQVPYAQGPNYPMLVYDQARKIHIIVNRDCFDHESYERV